MQLAGFRAGVPIYDFNIPNRLAIAIALGFADLARTNLITQINAHVVISNLARFGLADVKRARLALEDAANLSGNCARLERFAVVFQNFVVDGVARFGAQVAGELAGTVHFHADRVLTLLENVDRFFLVERKQILEMELIGADSRGIQLLDGFANHALGGTPADQRYLGVGRTLEAGRGKILERQIQLLHALFRDLAPDRGVAENVADQNAPLVVFVGRGDVHAIRRTGKRAGGNAGGRELITFVKTVFAVHFGDQSSAVDRYIGLEALGFDGFGMRREQQVRDDDDRALILLGEVEGFDRAVEAIGSVAGGDNDAREIALGSAINLVEIGLLLLGGNAGGRSAALNFDENDGRFDHAGHADGLGHQREASAGGGAHGARAGITGTDGHVGNGELVFHLLDDNAAALGMFGHPGEDAGRRRHGIGGVEPAAGGDSSNAECFVASDVGAALAGKFPLITEWHEVFLGVLKTGLQNAYVLVDYGFAFVAEGVCKHGGSNLKIEAKKEDERADGH